MKKRTFVCFLIFTLCVFHNSLQSPVFGQGASLAERVLEKYSHILQREDIQAVLPDVLDGLKAPNIQALLNPAVIAAAVANPDLLAVAGVEQRFIDLLKADAELLAMLSDAQVQALLQDTAAIDELAAALRIVEPPVVQPPSLAQQVFEKYSATLLRADIQAVLPDVLDGLKAPNIQALLNPAVIAAAVANPDLLAVAGVEQRFIDLLKTDAELLAMLSDAQVQALLQDTAAIDELAAALRIVEPPVVQPPSLAQQVFEKYSATLLRADIQAVLPDTLTAIKAPEIQAQLNPAIIAAAVATPDILAFVGVEQRFINLLKTDAEIQTVLSDAQVQELLQKPAAIEELAVLLRDPRSVTTAGPLGDPRGAVIINEIMFDSGGGTLPQWIELYNKSKTDAINLNRWKLEIQNVDSEDLVGRPIVTLTLQEKVIQPNQTLLIVAGPARASSGAYLPAERVYDLLALHEKNLRIKRARDTFLSAEGFYLKLTDRNGQLVDEVGNTDGNRRTDDIPTWDLPWSPWRTIRSSLIRRYDNGVALDGTARSGWVLAANIQKIVDDTLYYGHADDIGTPGYRQGSALPVELSSFTVTRNNSGAVVVTWTTESEIDNAGFNLRRSEKRDSGFTLLNPALIAGAGTTGERQTYTFTDTSAKPGIEAYYQLEEISFDGKRETLATQRLRGLVSAVNRQLTTLGAVKRRK